MATLNLGDQRLNRRQRLLLERMMSQPGASLPAASRGWGETMAAYRFFDNAKVTAEAVLAPHRRATLERIQGQPVVLVLQDTTEIELDRSPAGGFGKLTYDNRTGLMDHTRLAVTPAGLCLGVTGCDLWARPFDNPHAGTHNRDRSISAKESQRWLDGYRDACVIARQSPHTLVVSIADRESDVYECFLEAPQPPPGQAAQWITRAAQNRRLRPQPDDDSDEVKLRAAITDFPLQGTRTVTVAARPQRPAREALVEVRSGRVTLRAPYRQEVKLRDVSVNVVWVHEPHPPGGVEPLDWLLLTSLPVDSVADVLAVVDWYAARWWIELYFRTFKQGCRVERLQLQTFERVSAALALLKIVAWRLQFVTFLGRECPDVSCETVFSEAEWRSTWPIVTGHPAPTTPPPLGTFILQVAKLGGYLARKHDPPPGPQVLWQGLRRVLDFTLAWTSFQNLQSQATCVEG